jgi:cytochrome c553
MLATAMRILVMVGAALLLAAIAVTTWAVARGPTETEAAEIAAALAPTGAADAPPAYAHCAACHLHDGSGRPDGSIPRLNGQRQAVLQNKLFRLRTGMTRLPVMDPFARSLEPAEIQEIATYLAALPDPPNRPHEAQSEEHATGAALYAEHCASCHGAHGEGHDGLFASRLCGQYAGYMERRLREVRDKTRGDADAVMQGVLEGLPIEDLGPIVSFLAAGTGCVTP